MFFFIFFINIIFFTFQNTKCMHQVQNTTQLSMHSRTYIPSSNASIFIRSKTYEKFLTCMLCTKHSLKNNTYAIFPFLLPAVNHIKEHIAQAKKKCPFCKSPKNLLEIDRHAYQHIESFKQEENFLSPENITRLEKLLRCFLCAKGHNSAFFGMDIASDHIKHHIDSINRENIRKYNSNVFFCSACKQQIPGHDIVEHTSSHDKASECSTSIIYENPLFCCPYCSKITPKKEIYQHAHEHTNMLESTVREYELTDFNTEHKEMIDKAEQEVKELVINTIGLQIYRNGLYDCPFCFTFEILLKPDIHNHARWHIQNIDSMPSKHLQLLYQVNQ